MSRSSSRLLRVLLWWWSTGVFTLQSRTAHGLALEILAPKNGSCMGSSAVQVRAEVVLSDLSETVDDFIRLHGERQICVSVEGHDDDVVSSSNSSLMSCFPLDCPSMILPQVADGCHRLVAWLSGSSIRSPPAHFQVVPREGDVCTRVDRCAPYSGGGGDAASMVNTMTLNIDSPRPNDVVYGDSVHVSLYVSMANGTRVRPQGRLCLDCLLLLPSLQPGGGGGGGGEGRQEAEHREQCLDIEEAMFSEGMDLTVMLPSHGAASMAITTATFTTKEGVRMVTTDRVDMTFQRMDPPRTMQQVVLSSSFLDSHPSAFLPSLPTVLLLSHYEEDLTWVLHQPHHVIIYEKKSPAIGQEQHDSGLRHWVPHNVAGEATAFLKYIVDYYHALPVTTTFLHSHRSAYHQEDILVLLPLLQRHYDHHHLANDSHTSRRGTEYCTLNRVVWGSKEDPDRLYLRQHWDEWLGRWLGPLPPVLLERCCAQFMVHRDRIRRMPLPFYQEALVRLYQGGRQSKEESRRLGLLMEWVWHYVWGEEAVAEEELVPLIGMLPKVDRLAMTRRPPCLRSAVSEISGGDDDGGGCDGVSCVRGGSKADTCMCAM